MSIAGYFSVTRCFNVYTVKFTADLYTLFRTPYLVTFVEYFAVQLSEQFSIIFLIAYNFFSIISRAFSGHF